MGARRDLTSQKLDHHAHSHSQMEKLRSREGMYTTRGKDLELEPRSPEEYREYFEDKSVQSDGVPDCIAL